MSNINWLEIDRSAVIKIQNGDLYLVYGFTQSDGQRVDLVIYSYGKFEVQPENCPSYTEEEFLDIYSHYCLISKPR